MIANSRQQILEMVSSNTVTPAEGQALLAALEQRPQRTSDWLFDPLRVLSTRAALMIGVLGASVGITLSRFMIRFDGALDVHLTYRPVSWLTAATDVTVSWGSTALISYVLACISARRTRLIDVVAAVGLARVTLLVASFVALAAPAPELTGGLPDTAFLISALPMMVAALFAIAWSISMLVLGLRTASGLKGARWAVTAVGAIFLSELVSKGLLFALTP